MNSINWWLMALSFILGALLSWLYMVRRSTRKVPQYASAPRAAGAAVAAGAAAGAGTAAVATRETTAPVASRPTFTQARFGAGSALPLADGSGPSGWTIKGNEDSMLYHTTDSPAYGRTRAEVWFRDESTARAAGFKRWDTVAAGTPAAGLASTDAGGDSASKDASTGAAEGAATRAAATPAPRAVPPESPRATPHAEAPRATPHAESPRATAPAESPRAAAAPARAATTSGAGESRAAEPAGSAAAGAVAGAAAGAVTGKAASAPTFTQSRHGAGSALPLANGSGPTGWSIKGNEDSMLYHTSDSPSYGRTRAEVWFRDEPTAKAAGFARWDSGRGKAAGATGGVDASRAGVAAVPVAAASAGKFGEGSATPGPDGSGPAGWSVKGNEDSMLFHTTESPWYERTVAEVWFRDEESALKAGFKHWDRKRR